MPRHDAFNDRRQFATFDATETAISAEPYEMSTFNAGVAAVHGRDHNDATCFLREPYVTGQPLNSPPSHLDEDYAF
ncbi:MAG: hypothetical protein JSS49_04375 [Planctomycetes bacterium]|nr:hypothetical protein [Planctomycetota bacterium]